MSNSIPSEPIHVGTLTHVGAATSKISGCAVNVLRNLDPTRFEGRIWASHAIDAVRGFPEVKLTIPPLVFRAACRVRVPEELIRTWSEQQFLRQLHPTALAWAFPAWTPQLFKQLKSRGHRIVLERVNSSIANASAILSEVSSRYSLPLPKGIDQSAIEQERLELEHSDYVFVCSPFVEKSFLDIGVTKSRLIRCSYGWDPTAYPFPTELSLVDANPRFLFAGSGCVRKGLADLLGIWSRFNPPARLRIVGAIEPPIAHRFADVLARPEVETFGFDSDLARHYRDSHVFVLPSHEEGSPLVTYIALGAGLPSLVSFPGAGGIVRDNIEGLVREPTNVDDFADALMRLATDAQLRERLGTAAKSASRNYTWARVAAARGEAFEGILSGAFDATTIPWPADSAL